MVVVQVNGRCFLNRENPLCKPPGQRSCGPGVFILRSGILRQLPRMLKLNEIVLTALVEFRLHMRRYDIVRRADYLCQVAY